MPGESVATVTAIGNVRSDTFIAHWRAIHDAKDEQSTHSSRVSQAKKAAKRDGVDMDVVQMLEVLSNKDVDERLSLIRKLYVYSDWLSMPLSAAAEGLQQPPAPKESTQREFEEWQAGRAGLLAGKRGHPRESNPYQADKADSPEYAAWDRKWSQGFRQNQKKLAGQLARNATNGSGRHKSNGVRPHA
jgi:hypothetical protein